LTIDENFAVVRVFLFFSSSDPNAVANNIFIALKMQIICLRLVFIMLAPVFPVRFVLCA